MNIVDHDVFEAVRRGYGALEAASDDEIREYFASVEPESVSGHARNIKGILFEQEYVDSLNIAGIEASVFEYTNHVGTDVMVFGGLGNVSEIQLKATDSVSYVTAAMEQDPEITFAVTSEVAAQIGNELVIDAGIENAALELAVDETLFNELVAPIGPISILRFLFGLPF